MADTEELWLPRKVHNHLRKFVYGNDGQNQEYGGGLRYICYNKMCKHGYVQAPTLFSVFLPAMLEEAFKNMGHGVYIQSRQYAHLFTITHFRRRDPENY